MKIKFNPDQLINAFLVVAIVVLSLSYFIHYNPPSDLTAEGINQYTIDDRLPAIDPPLPDSIPHRDYIKLAEKIKVARKLNNGTLLHDGSIDGIAIGVRGGLYCDTCTVNSASYDSPGIAQYYLTLNGWQLSSKAQPIDSIRFYTKHGQGYLRKPMMDKPARRLYYVEIPVKFRYDETDPGILIPISKLTWTILNNILTALSIILAVYYCLLVVAFVKFAIDISRGLTFTINNVFRLKLIAFSFIGFPVLGLLANLVLRLLFHSYFTSDVVLKSDTWTNGRTFICIGIAFLLLYRAFNQGMKLKEEHDLTV